MIQILAADPLRTVDGSTIRVPSEVPQSAARISAVTFGGQRTEHRAEIHSIWGRKAVLRRGLDEARCLRATDGVTKISESRRKSSRGMTEIAYDPVLDRRLPRSRNRGDPMCELSHELV